MKNSVQRLFTAFRPVATIALGCAVVAATAGTPARADSDADRSAIGLKIAPVPLNMKGLNPTNVGLGSYWVTVASCSGCHTTPEFKTGSDPFNGDPKTAVDPSAYFAGGVGFGPGVCSANITPDKNRLPAGLTLPNFISAMRTGHDFRDPKGDLLQVMPWPYFRHLMTKDLAAIYAYLRALPSNATKTCS